MVTAALGAGDGLVEQLPGPDRVNQVDAQLVSGQGLGEQDVVVQRPGPLDGLLAERQAALGLPGEVTGGTENGEGLDEHAGVVHLAGDLDRPFAVPLRRRYVGDAGDARGHDQGPAEQHLVGPGRGPLEHRREQVQGFPAPGAREPVPVLGHGEAQDLLGAGRPAGRGPGRAPQVRVVEVQPGEPGTLVRSPQMRIGRLGDGQVIPAVGVRDDGGLVLTGLGEAFRRELADRLQQPVAQGVPGWFGRDQALVHQRADQPGDVEHLDIVQAADRLGRVEIEALRERRQPPQQRALRVVEQRIGPVDGRPQRLLARQGGPAPAGEQAEALVEAVEQAVQGQGAQPGGGELDGQRQPVQPAADRHDDRDRVVADRQPDALGPGPVHEQRDRVRGLGRHRAGIAGLRQRQRRHPVDDLSADAERLTAGGEQAHPRASPDEGIGGLGARVDQVLAVVEDDQDVLRDQGVEQGLQGGPAGLRDDPERSGDGRRHGLGVGDRGQFDQPHPVAAAVEQLGGHLQAQPRLAAPAGPGQGDHARGVHQGPHLCELPGASDERGELGREVVRQRLVAERAQRRELGRQARHLELEDVLRTAEILQPVDTEILQRRPGGKRIAHQRRRRLGQQDLAAVPDRGHPGGAVDVQADQAVRGLGRLAGVDTHPHPDVLPAGPGVCLQRLLHGDDRGQAGARRGEHGEQPVALGVHLPSAVSGQAGPDERAVIGDDLRVAACFQPPQQNGRALDVGEEERERLHGHSLEGRPGQRPCQRGWRPALNAAWNSA